MRQMLGALLCAVAFAAPAQAGQVVLAPAQFSTEFAQTLNEDLGAREGERLQRAVDTALRRELARNGGVISPQGPVTIETVIVEARENRPTFAQLTRNTSLSFESISTGGAELIGIIRSGDGRELARVTHRFFETDISNASPAPWGDAQSAINGFAYRVAQAYRALGV